MALLKEDGSLDVERISKLPLEEKMREIATMTKKQHKEYVSKIPMNESNKTKPVLYGSLERDLASGKWFDMKEIFNNLLKNNKL